MIIPFPISRTISSHLVNLVPRQFAPVLDERLSVARPQPFISHTLLYSLSNCFSVLSSGLLLGILLLLLGLRSVPMVALGLWVIIPSYSRPVRFSVSLHWFPSRVLMDSDYVKFFLSHMLVISI